MNIRKVDYNDPEAKTQFVQSLKETGFAIVTNHPVHSKILEAAYATWSVFFSNSKKHGYLFDKTKHSGYFPYRSENAKDHSVKDLKEFYHIYNLGDIPKDLPDDIPTIEILVTLRGIASVLLGWIDSHAPVEVTSKFSESLTDMAFSSDRTLFRVIHYPPIIGEAEPGAVRAAAHEDINLITLLPAATNPGLQVKDSEGNWHEVECDPGSIIVNVGDMLQLASDGYFKSTTHRVINPSGNDANKSRYSMPLFVHPRPEVKLSSDKTAAQYLDERLKELGLK